MFAIIIVTCLLVEAALAGFMQSSQSNGWSGIMDNYGGGMYENFGDSQTVSQNHETFVNADNYQLGNHESSNYGVFDGGHGILGGDHGGIVNHGVGWDQHQHAHAYPIGQHIEVIRPVTIPVYKNIGVPVAQPVAIRVPHPVAIGVPQPYPVHVPVAQAVAIPVVKTIAVPIEKKVPYPVEKIIPVPVEKPVPITIEKHIPVPVEKPYPIHIPVYKHIFHRAKHSHGWGR